MIKCLKCGTELSDNAKFCNNCGERVDGKTVCPKCNKEIAANSNFCEFCGYVVKKTDVISDYVVRRRKKLSGE
ncbi:MAG: zinc ribbon domain-containing protein, partial [Clostridia bacterium]|nr:zinc ribbon domain-containing protein [Clostridia bacterium]